MYQESFANGELSSLVQSSIAPNISRNRLIGLAGTALSVVLLVAAVLQGRNLDLPGLRRMLPSGLTFWLTFAGWYMLGPVCDWVIYRRLWRIPLSGLLPLVRKLVSNELVFGYLGEAQFYAWARARGTLTAAPFGTIKDVALLSALAGNCATLALLLAAWPLIATQAGGLGLRATFLSLGVVLFGSFAMLLFRRRLFTLPRRKLRFIFAMHALRIFTALGLSAILWHLALPRIALGTWLVIAALQMLVSRLPLIPHKDIVFASAAMFLLGGEPQVGALMALLAGVTLALHIVVGTGFAIADIGKAGLNESSLFGAPSQRARR